MGISQTLHDGQAELLAQPASTNTQRQETRFHRSLRSKGYIFFLLVLTYLMLATAFFFSQREKPLLQLEQYQRIQNTQEVLMQADIAAFHVVTVLFSDVTRAEYNQVAAYFSNLQNSYRKLRWLFPEEAAAFSRLEQSIPLAIGNPGGDYLQKAHLHLAQSKSELERLMAANQARMSSLVAEYRRNDDLLVIKSMVLGTLGLILILTITTRFFNRLKSDLLQLQQRTTEIVDGYRGDPLPVTRDDEVGQLTEGINHMSKALAEREQALEIERRKAAFREKMIAIDSLAGGIAHEVGNPITCIDGLAGEIANDPQNRLSEESRTRLDELRQYSEGIAAITRELSNLETNGHESAEWLDANQLLTNAVNLCRYDNRWSGIELALEVDPGLPAIFGSENQLNQLAMHILENALNAVSNRENPEVRVRAVANSEINGIRISFEDNGIGVEGEDAEYIFEPFYSTKAVGEGTGLGLPICRNIVKQHHGDIRAESAPGTGLKIIIDLPCGNVTPGTIN